MTSYPARGTAATEERFHHRAHGIHREDPRQAFSVFSVLVFPDSFAACKDFGSGTLNLEFWMRPLGRAVPSVVNLFLARIRTSRLSLMRRAPRMRAANVPAALQINTSLHRRWVCQKWNFSANWICLGSLGLSSVAVISPKVEVLL